ncbi:MAG TPA: HAMP domain-containing sensor histidine kinase [Candidatus Dormibacteraeota bacterium]|nr:HAMP domain-containing sensor histidine kinase [Candidatus Dormibacteraeota bacterium]
MARSPSPTYAPALRQAPETGLFSSPSRESVRVVGGFGFRGWGAFTIAATSAGILSVAFVVWTALRIGGDQATIAVDDIGEAVAALIAAVSCGFAAARTTNRTRLAWAFFAASAASWGIGEVVWSVYEVGLGVSVPFPSAADAGFLLAIPLAVAGVFAFTSAPARLATRGEALLAGAIVALSLLFVAWALGLGMVYDTSTASPPARLIGLAYPLGDIVTITVLVLALRRARRTELGSLFLLLGGLASAAAADSAFAYLTASGAYGAIGSLLDAGWVIGYLMIALAPIWPATDTEKVRSEGPIELWQLALPWAAVVAAALTAIKLVSNNQVLDRFETVLAGCIGLLLVGSQVLSHRDSLSLLVASRRIEDQLQRRNNLLDEIVSHAPLGIVRVGPDMRIIDVNPRMAALMRAHAGQMVGMPVAAYLDPSEFTRVFDLFKPLWTGDVDSIESDSRAVRGDRTSAWLHWSATTVRNAAGRVEYFLAMYEDTDAQHAANEAATAHLAGIERLNQLKSEFITLVSHEFRTGLVGIQGFSEMIRDADDLAREDIKAFAADINKDAQRLNRMINDMLDLDRIEAGRLTLRLESVDINVVLQDAVERARASSERHTIEVKLDPSQPVTECDADRVAQIVANLLTNAVKYSPDGGEILVSSQAGEGFVEVSVRDHGVGIAPEFAKRLFSRYERYEKTSGKIIGTGLGLAIARQIVEMHGGRIWVDTTVGSGSDFRFALPMTLPKASA